MYEKKTSLSLLRNQDWKTVKAQNEKINILLIHASMGHSSEVKELIYAGVKIILRKNRGSPKENEQKLKI